NSVKAALKQCVESEPEPAADYETFRDLPLASWIEDTFGLKREQEAGRFIRETPQPLRGKSGAVARLAALTGCGEMQCELAIRRYFCVGCQSKNPETEYPPLFAFRLHQFITRGDTVWASIEPEHTRAIELRGQQYVPGDRNKILLP